MRGAAPGGSGLRNAALAALLVLAAHALTLDAGAAHAASHQAAGDLAPTLLSVGDHGEFGRVVFRLAHAAALSETPQEVRDGDRLIVTLPGAGPILRAVPGGDVTRHVRGIALGTGRAVLTLDPGSVTRVWRSGARVVVDVFGPPRAGAGTPVKTQAGMAPSDPGPADTTRRLGRGASGQRPENPAAKETGPAQTASSRQPAQATPGSSISPAPRSMPDGKYRGAPLPAATLATAAPPATGAARSAAMTALGALATRDAAPAAPDAPAAPATPPQADAAPAAPDPASAESAPSDALRAQRLAGPGDAILLPFDSQTGAAAFTHGGLAHAVFDTAKAIDLAPLKGDPVFGTARITLLPDATHLSMVLPPGRRVTLHHRPSGWALAVESAGAQGESAPARLQGGIVSIGMPNAADSVAIVDDATGGTLLVGTVRDHGPAVLVPHASPEYTLLPSWEGVLAAPGSDRVALAAVKAGFTLRAATGPPLSSILSDGSQAALEQAGALTRRFDIPLLPVPGLLRRLSADIEAAAAAAKRARFAPRLRAAQDMLALGMGREATSLLNAAREDDPAQAERPDMAALRAMARFLTLGAPSRAPDDASADRALADPALGGSDEVALWRALAAPGSLNAAARGAVLAGNWRLLLGYPAPLRRRLTPAAAAILADGRQSGVAQALLDAAQADGDATPALAMVRAGLLRLAGKPAEALAMLDGIAASTDRKNGALAFRAALEQRVQTGSLPPAKAGARLLSQIDRWRDPAFETEARLRAASLLVQGGAFRDGLAQMRATEALFPEAHDQVHDAEQRAVQALIAAGAGATLPPLDLVALVEENADLLGEHMVAHVLTPLVVEKLVALDLPQRAEKLVATLMARATDAGSRAALGSQLAGLRLDARDAAGADAALDQSDSADLPPSLTEARAIQRARALLLLGKDESALLVLAPLQSAEALSLRAGLLEHRKDWRGAENTLNRLTESIIPHVGPLTAPQQDLVLRLAGAASQAGDGMLLRRLQNGDARRLTQGPRTALFQVLAAAPVQGIADLPRSAREADAARALPAALASYETR